MKIENMNTNMVTMIASGTVVLQEAKIPKLGEISSYEKLARKAFEYRGYILGEITSLKVLSNLKVG